MQNSQFRILKMAAVSSKGQAKRKKKKGQDKEAAEDKFSIPHQLAMCDSLFPSHPNWVDVGTVIIPGHSRRYDFLQDLVRDCKEYADMIARVDRRECDGLLCAYFDRLQRGVILAPQLAVYCAERGVQIRWVDRFQEFLPPDQFAGLSPMEKLTYSFEGFAAESYADAMRKKMGPALLARVRDRGLPIHPHTPYGYKRGSDSDEPEIQVPEEVAWLRRGLRWRIERLWGWPRMAREARLLGWRTRAGNEWTAVSMYVIYTNSFLAGYVRRGEITAKGQHEPIWSEEEWAQLCEVREINRSRRLPPTEHEFTSLCTCGICGAPMAHHRGPDGRPQRLVCTSINKYADGRYRRDGSHHRNTHRMAEVRAYVIGRVQAELRDSDAFMARRAAQAQGQTGEDIATIEAALRDTARAWERWDRAYEQEAIDALQLKAHHERLRNQRRELEQRIADARSREAARLAAAANLREIASSQIELDRLLASLPDLPDLERRRLWLVLIRRIILVKGEPPVIEWR